MKKGRERITELEERRVKVKRQRRINREKEERRGGEIVTAMRQKIYNQIIN